MIIYSSHTIIYSKNLEKAGHSIYKPYVSEGRKLLLKRFPN